MQTSVELTGGHFRDFLDPAIDTDAYDVLRPVSGPKDRVLAKAGETAFRMSGAYRFDDSSDGQQWGVPDGSGGWAVLEVTDPDRFMRSLIESGDIGLFYGFTGGSDEDILWRANPRLTHIPEDVDTGNPEVDSLVTVTTALHLSTQRLRRIAQGAASLIAPIQDRRAQSQWSSSTERTKAEIAAHYDLSQRVYNGEHGFLDIYGQYSAGLLLPGQKFESLDHLQEQKIDSLARKLELETAHTLLEVGSGWGGLAVELAKRAPHLHITSLTVSEEQAKIARQHAEDEGVADRVNFLCRDYRDYETGGFDRVVSVEMIEAVDWRDMPEYFDALTEKVNPETGIIVLQSINLPPEQFARHRQHKNFANTAIFPGGILTPKQFIQDMMAKRGWRTHEETELGPSYALTLREWLRNLHANKPDLAEIWRNEGVPAEKIERFYRGFSLYLAACEAVFRPEISHLEDWQITFRPQKISSS